MTNYRVSVHADDCIGCANCEPRCQLDAVHVVDGTAVIDVARCIGCGLCVTTCSTDAMRLEPHPSSAQPARNTPELYLKMYRERFGAYETAKAIGKAMLRRRV